MSWAWSSREAEVRLQRCRERLRDVRGRIARLRLGGTPEATQVHLAARRARLLLIEHDLRADCKWLGGALASLGEDDVLN